MLVTLFQFCLFTSLHKYMKVRIPLKDVLIVKCNYTTIKLSLEQYFIPLIKSKQYYNISCYTYIFNK